MNITDFYNNPAGKGATALNIKAIKSQLDERYEGVRESLLTDLYVTNDAFYYKVGLPSTKEGIVYDVIIMFATKDQNELSKAPIKLFSNSPSFVFTYAYAYNRNGLLIKDLASKLSKEALTKAPKEKNPYNMVSFDFSIYAAVKNFIENVSNLTSEPAKKIGRSDVKLLAKNFTDLQSARNPKKNIEEAIKEEKKAASRVKVTMTPKAVKQVKRSTKIKSAKTI